MNHILTLLDGRGVHRYRNFSKIFRKIKMYKTYIACLSYAINILSQYMHFLDHLIYMQHIEFYDILMEISLIKYEFDNYIVGLLMFMKYSMNQV